MRHRNRALLAIAASAFVSSRTLAQTPDREVPFNAAANIEIHMEAEGTPAADPPARVQAAAAQWARQLGQPKPGAKTSTRNGPNGNFTVLTEQYTGDPKHVHTFLATDRDGAICHVRAGISLSMLTGISSAMQRCAAELGHSSGPQTASAGAPTSATGTPTAGTGTQPSPGRGTAAVPRGSHAEQPPASADQPPAHPENWDRVHGVYFQVAYGGGAGGMLIVEYKPIVFFKDGTTFETGEAALEDVDLNRERRDRASMWGTWRQNGSAFQLTDDRGRSQTYKLQDGQLFQAFPAEKGGPLNAKYESVGGGGNSAMGGEMTILSQHNMAFTRDGRFATKSDTAILGNGQNSGVGIAGGANRHMTAPGTYKLSRYTLELHYPNGRSERRFFAYSSSGADGHLSRDMIFIGDTGYTTE